jgi:hypothetical protein
MNEGAGTPQIAEFPPLFVWAEDFINVNQDEQEKAQKIYLIADKDSSP